MSVKDQNQSLVDVLMTKTGACIFATIDPSGAETPDFDLKNRYVENICSRYADS